MWLCSDEVKLWKIHRKPAQYIAPENLLSLSLCCEPLWEKKKGGI